MMLPNEFYKNLYIARQGHYTGKEDELQAQLSGERSLSDILLWKAQRKALRREYRKTTPAVGSMKRSFISNGR